MRFLRGAGFAGTVILGATVLVSGGCGYKNLPVPPESVVPKPIEDLRYTKGEDSVELSWTYPEETVNGRNIMAISSFELYRAEVPADDYCATCPIPYAQPISIEGGVTQEEGVLRIASYQSGLLRPGYKYFFKVQARTNWWATSDDSNVITFVWEEPVAAPVGIKTITNESGVVINWQPVTTYADGSPLSDDVMYQVYRSTDGGGFAKYKGPIATTSIIDDEMEKGVDYSYQVQSLLRVGGDYVVGGMSDVTSAAAFDSIAPAVPDSVKAIGTGTGVKVIWNKVGDEDLAGYNVYRKKGGESSYKKVGTVEVPYTIFMDSSVSEDEEVSYVVTAFDDSTPANESKQSKEATIRP